jgi:hypothetical protein
VFADPMILEAEVPGVVASAATASANAGPHPARCSFQTLSCRSSQRWVRVEMSGLPRPLLRRKRRRGFSESPQLVRSRP